MGEIVRFPTEKVQRSSGTEDPDKKPGTVVFFEGVRYAAAEIEKKTRKQQALKPAR